MTQYTTPPPVVGFSQHRSEKLFFVEQWRRKARRGPGGGVLVPCYSLRMIHKEKRFLMSTKYIHTDNPPSHIDISCLLDDREERGKSPITHTYTDMYNCFVTLGMMERG